MPKPGMEMPPEKPPQFETPDFTGTTDRVWIKAPQPKLSDVLFIRLLTLLVDLGSVAFNMLWLLFLPTNTIDVHIHCIVSGVVSIFCFRSTFKFGPDEMKSQVCLSSLNTLLNFSGAIQWLLWIPRNVSSGAKCDPQVKMCLNPMDLFGFKTPIECFVLRGVLLTSIFLAFGELWRCVTLYNLKYYNVEEPFPVKKPAVETKEEKKDEEKEKNPNDIIIAA